jgi:hypothetical protein
VNCSGISLLFITNLNHNLNPPKTNERKSRKERETKVIRMQSVLLKSICSDLRIKVSAQVQCSLRGCSPKSDLTFVRPLSSGSCRKEAQLSNLNRPSPGLVQSRSFSSDQSGQTERTRVVREDYVPTLMPMPMLTAPNPMAIIWNWIYYAYRMPQFDTNFQIQPFLAGTKKVCLTLI